MKDIKVNVSFNNEKKVLLIEPINKATGKTAYKERMIARLLTQEEIDRGYEEAMQLGCHIYERKNGRIRQRR